MRVPLLVLVVFFPGVFLSSRVTGACPMTTDLIMRVNVRTITAVYTVPLGKSPTKKKNGELLKRRMCPQLAVIAPHSRHGDKILEVRPG